LFVLTMVHQRPREQNSRIYPYITEIRYMNLLKGGTSTVNMRAADLAVKNTYREVVAGGPSSYWSKPMLCI